MYKTVLDTGTDSSQCTQQKKFLLLWCLHSSGIFLKCMCMDCKSGSNKYLAGKSYLLLPKSFFVLHLNLSAPTVYYFHIQVTVFSGISI